jgi:hypothetical protein
MFDRIAVAVTWTWIVGMFLGIAFMAGAVVYAMVMAMIG